MHFAASISVADSVAQPAAYYANNFAETVAFADALVAAGVRALVFSSTAAVYGDADGDALAETARIAPINPYGHSKAMAEQALRDIAAATPGLSVAILRYFNVAGADPAGRSGQASHHPHHLIELSTQVVTGLRAEFTIFGDDYATPDGTGVRDYVHVSDVAAAHVMLLRAGLATPGQVHCFNLGYGHGHSVKAVLSALATVAGQPIPTRIGPRRPGDPARLVAATDALRAAGWQPAHDDLPAMLGHALAWERKRQQQKCGG
jgi:UDP-glucose 4-epimerase